MRKFFGVAAVVVIVLTMGVGTASSALPSAKATANVGDIAITNSQAQDWTTVLENTLKTPNQKDLFIDVSLECGLYTRTLVKSAGSRDTSVAEAGVKVRVLVDDTEAYPGEVVFCRRTQTLSALFGGILESCTDGSVPGSLPDGTITNDECTWTNEELELILDTMNANAFNFVLDDLGPGEHTVSVQARIDTNTDVDTGEADAWATIGMGSMTVEEVRLIKGEDILELP
jgi:hypothetical protein